MSATVCNDRGWTKTTNMDLLRSIDAVSMGPRHNPINHGTVLERFRDRAASAGVEITAEQGLLSPDKKRFMHVADIRYDSLNSDFAFTVGFINFNDRTRSFTTIAGQRVFVCSNLCITGTLEESRTRHSTNVDGRLDARMDTAFAKFDEMFRVQMSNVDAMKAEKLTDALVGKFMLEATRQDLMGATNLRRIVEEIDKPTLNNVNDNSAWRLHNAATYVLRENVKNPLLVAETTKRANDIISGLVAA
jgi:hypothetical protein